MKIGYETAMLKLVCSKVSQAFKMQVIKKAKRFHILFIRSRKETNVSPLTLIQ